MDIRPKKKKIFLNDVDISEYVKEITATSEHKEYIGEATIILKRTVTEVINIDIDNVTGWKVIWQRGVESPDETFEFRGEVDNAEIDGATFVLQCVDRYYEAVRSNINYSYDKNIDVQAGVASEIYKDMINVFTTLLTDDSMVVSTADRPRVKKFLCRNTDVFERADKLAERYNYQHYYDPIENKTAFEPLGYHETGQTLEVSKEIIENPVWKTDKSKLTNVLTVKGAEQLVERTKHVDGTGEEGQTIVLPYTPRSVKIYVGEGTFDPDNGDKPSNNEDNLLIGGKQGSVSGEYDYEYDDDKRIKTIYFYNPENGEQPSFIPPSGTKNIEVRYTYALPVQVTGRREESIERYGKHERTEERSDIKNFDDAFEFLKGYLDFYDRPFITTKLKVSNAGEIKPGRVYRIIDNDKGINKRLIVSKVKKQWPYNFDEVDVGTEVLRQLEFSQKVIDKLKRLDEITAESDDLLIESVEFTSDIMLENRYKKIYTRDVDSNVGIWGHPTLGVWGECNWGSYDDLPDPVLVELIQGHQTYNEMIYDNDFFDSDRSDSNVTWDVENNEIVIPPQSTLYTSSIELNTYRNDFNVKLNENIINNENMEVSITYNNNDWILVENIGQTINFPEPSTDIRLKIFNKVELW